MDFDSTQQRDVNRVFSFYNVLKIISDIDDYRKWIKSYHQLDNDSIFLDGYKFMCEVAINGLIDAFHYDDSFDLNDDIVYYRANFTGVYIDDIPNTSEKIVFMKNLWNNLKRINEQNSWDDIANYWTITQDIFTIFDKVFHEDVVSTELSDKNLALKITTMRHTHIFLNDTQRGKPHTFPCPFLEKELSIGHLDKSFIGYSFSLQYLWFKLLGKEKYESTSITKMCDSIELYSHNLIQELYDEDFIFGCYDEEVLPTLVKWKYLDRFFSKINTEIIEPLAAEYGIESSINTLFLKEYFNKKKLDFLLNKETVPIPTYLVDDSTPELKMKKLNYYFYWEMLYKLDCQQIITDGISTFTALLMGSVQTKSIHDTKESVEVLRIKHPVEYTEGFDYSYAILVESYSSLSDYSDWYVFFDCATDYSGFGGSLHQRAEATIEHYTEKNVINIREIIVDKTFFQNYLDNVILSSVERIRSEASFISKQTKGTSVESIANKVKEEVQKIYVQNPKQLEENLANLLFSIRALVPPIAENKLIIDKINEIDKCKVVEDKIAMIGTIILLVPTISVNHKLDEIKKDNEQIREDLDQVLGSIENIRISLEPGIEEFLQVTVGASAMGSGFKSIINIPIKEISYSGIEDDIRKYSDKYAGLDSFPERLTSKLLGYIRKISR